MPPFPWHFGGQRFHNLFVDMSFIRVSVRNKACEFALMFPIQLACNHLHFPFREFLDQILPFTAHLHLADAKDVDGEGLQINEEILIGHNCFNRSINIVHRPLIPEIWQGHKNGGEGAWLALQRLENSP